MDIVQRSFFAPVTFGELAVDPFDVWWKGAHVELTKLQREIVLRMIQTGGQVVRWPELAGALDFTDFNESVYTTMRSYVCRTRKAFFDVDPDFTQLETVAGVGFRWRV